MISKRSEKLKKSCIIIAIVFVVLAIICFVVSGALADEAEAIKEQAYVGALLGNSSLATEYELLNTLSMVLVVVGIIAIIGAVGYIVWILAVYYRTYIVIKGDNVSGVGVVGLFSRKSFSGMLQNVVDPLTNKNVVAFSLNGVRYLIYTDDAATVYRMLKDNKKTN